MEIGFLQEIKAIVKSLVLSCPQEITLEKLNKDFRDIEGYPIPYGRLGFQNLESFLRSIDDTVKIQGKGTLATLHFVANHKSDHIHEMIRKQKKTKRTKLKNSKSVFQHPVNYKHPEQSRTLVNSRFRYSQFYIKNEQWGGVINPISPDAALAEHFYNKNEMFDKKTKFKKVADNFESKLQKKSFAKPLKDPDIDQTHVLDLVDTFRDTVCITNNNCAMNIARSCNKTNKPQNINNYKIHNVPANVLTVGKKFDKLQEGKKSKFDNLLGPSMIDKNIKTPEMDIYHNNNISRSAECNKIDKLKQATTLSKNAIPDNLSQDVYALGHFNYKNKIGDIQHKLKKNTLNCSLQMSRPSVVSKKKGTKTKLMWNNPIPEELDLDHNFDHKNVSNNPPNIKRKENSNNKIALPQDNNKSDFFEVSNSSTDIFDDIDEAVPQFAANNLVFRLDFPEHTIVFGKKILSYKIPNNIKKGSIVGIFISEIHNPFKFWFHIHKENHELDILMHHIERFYMSIDKDEFIMPRTCHSPGQICAALYNDLWHRAEIISNIMNNKTKVFFLDYGTVSEVSVEHIKYLASMFAEVPSQAVRGCLSHIKPIRHHWSHESTKCFLSLVCEMMLYGQVADIDQQNRILYMVICNTNGPEVIQANRTLVEKKFAYYDDEWQNQRIAKNGMRWHHPREDFPTFEMLESGEYPSLSEIIDLQNKGIDYEKIIDQKVFHRGKLNNHEMAPEALRNLPFQLLNNNPFRCDIVFELYRTIKLI